jgi:hypothetical protein
VTARNHPGQPAPQPPWPDPPGLPPQPGPVGARAYLTLVAVAMAAPAGWVAGGLWGWLT